MYVHAPLLFLIIHAHTRFQHKICVIVLFSVSEAKNRDVITKPPAIKLKVSQSTPMETNC